MQPLAPEDGNALRQVRDTKRDGAQLRPILANHLEGDMVLANPARMPGPDIGDREQRLRRAGAKRPDALNEIEQCAVGGAGA